jgi:hypothetical protein
VASRCPEVLLGGLDEPRSTSRSVIHMPTVTFTEVEAASRRSDFSTGIPFLPTRTVTNLPRRVTEVKEW